MRKAEQKLLINTAARVAALLLAGALGWNSLHDSRVPELQQALAGLLTAGATAMSIRNQRRLLRTPPPEDK